MNRQACFLTLLFVFPLLAFGRPLAAQDDLEPGDPVDLPNVVLVDPAPGEPWLPYEMVVEGTTTVSPPPAINKPMARAGMTDYVQLDVLLVMYTNTAAGYMDSVYVEMAKEHARRTRDYIWRNSHFKLFLNLTFLVIDDYMDASEFLTDMTCNWMAPDDYDGDGESPSHDILAHGYEQDEFDSINLLWARSYHGSISLCPYGGLAWLTGHQWQHLGHTMFTTNLMYPSGEALWIPFNHEFQHSIDGAFELNGRYEYFHADYPWMSPYRFGDNWHFHAVEMRRWPAEEWLDLVGIWGEFKQAPDLDGDGLPDSGDLPVTEMSLGSSPASIDSEGDAVDDLQEAMAGMFNASNLLNSNTDGDVWEDVDDFAPLYPLNDRFVKKQRVLDGNPDGWTLLTDHLQVPAGSFSAAVYGNWFEDMLYLMFEINQPARIHVRIDGKADGFWTGRDNYAIELYPSGDPLRFATVNDCTPQQTNLENQCRYDNDPYYAFPRVINPAEFGRFLKYDGENYIIQLAVPADVDSGFQPHFPIEIGLDLRFDDVDGAWGRTARPFEMDDLVYLRLLTVDAAETEGQLQSLDSCGYDDGPLADAQVLFTGISGQKYEATSDLDGRYDLWLFEADNPYTLTVSKNGYETMVYEGITVDAMGPNKHEVTLRRNAPCISVDPPYSSQTVRLGSIDGGNILIKNDGPAGTDFSLSINYDGGYADWLSVSPSTGWLEAGGEVQVTLTYDGSFPGVTPGLLTATVVLLTDDPYSPMGHHVEMEIVDYGLELVPETVQATGAPGTDVTGNFTLTNTGSVVDEYDISAGSLWPISLSDSSLSLQPGESGHLTVTVSIPQGVHTGESETAVLTATSQAAPDVMAESTFSLTVREKPLVFLPVVNRP